ncbi:MAG: sensor protein [Gemmatimonadetes bacterium]|nr:sensor protein [Gemmatimonadota bacterium]
MKAHSNAERMTAGVAASPYGNAARTIAPFLEHGRECCFFLYFNMQVGFLNAAARRDVRAHGGDPDRYPGSSIWDLLGHPDDTPARIVVEWVARERMPAYFSTRASVADTAWVETDVVPLEEGILVSYRDAPSPRAPSEPRLAPRLKRGSGEHFKIKADDLPFALIALDGDAVVRQWSHAAEEMFQWRAQDVLDKRLPLVTAEEWPVMSALLRRVLDGESVQGDVRLVSRNGRPVEARLVASLSRDSSGATTILLTITDETARQRVEMARRATERMDAVRLLSGGVAHEFNNLLTAIKGFTVLLRGSVAGDGQAQQHVTEIDNAASRAATLTSQLLAFGRGLLLRPEAIDLNARLRQLERTLRLMLREDGELELILDADLGHSLVDPDQFEEAILNLIVAARDGIRGREGGRVTISTSNVDLDGEFEEWDVEGDAGPYVRIDVSHNGGAMDRVTQSHIFEPFYSMREGEVRGLGLATVFGIVKQSGGYIWVASDGHSGVVFSVFLPRVAGTGVNAPHGARHAGSEGPDIEPARERILLVEDEDAVRRIARRSLETCGYEIIEAADGAAALKLAEEQDIDLVLTDVMMPAMLGTTLVERLRARTPELPVLFMSGHCDALVRDGIIHPTTPFLQKPFTPAQLAQKVRETLTRAKRGAR